jgi:hypothetical protein
MASPAGAQQRVLGKVERIRDLETREYLDRTPRARVAQLQGNTWAEFVRNAELRADQRIRLNRLLNLRARVDDRGNKGTLVFATDLLFEEDQKARVLADEVVDSSRYIVRSGFLGPEVEIEEGTLVVKWDKGQITVLAAGNTVTVRGTTVAFHVFAGGDSVLVYLGEGALFFGEGSTTPAADRTLYMVRRASPNAPPEVRNSSVSTGQLERWRSTLSVHARKVWPSPGLLGVSWPVWGVIGGGALLGCVATKCYPHDGRSVIVALRLPF